jgi:hypothetical protein
VHAPARMKRRLARTAIAAGLALSLLGCASQSARTPPTEAPGQAVAAFAGNQGAAWEVIFAPGLQSEADADLDTRRDAAMNIREAQPVTALGMWPQEPRPHLGQTRRLFLPRRADDMLFIRDRHPYRHPSWYWH